MLYDTLVERSRARIRAAIENGGLDQHVALGTAWGLPVSLRRLLTDLVEEYGRHTGHADLLREAVDGRVGEWHLSHYASLARGGAGLVVVEATAVAPEGRITPGCAGIWSDDLAQAFVPIVRQIKAGGAVPGIQIAHAGRKASANRPWEGDDHIAEGDPRGWPTIAPSAIAAMPWDSTVSMRVCHIARAAAS